jgi:phosphatidylglycerol:prolipoprotein diacylglycerol transferase
LYEAAATAVIFIVLLLLRRKRAFEGQIILAYAALYSIARFIIEFWRDDPRGQVWGLSTSQFIAVIVFIGSVVLYVRRLKQRAVEPERSKASAA